MGEPVSILLYLADCPSFKIAFVLLAFIFLIVVDSSTANKKLLRCVNASKYFATFAVAKASTLTSSILNITRDLTPSSNTIYSDLLAPDFHIYILLGTSSGK